jgi:hypothetical protein
MSFGLVRDQNDLATMRVLKQGRARQVSIDTFTKGVLDLAVTAIMAAIP